MPESLVSVVVEGLTATVPAAEREAARRPPYPTPAAQAPARDRLLAELAALLPATGDGPRTVTRVRGAAVPHRSVVSSLNRPGRFDFSDAACALLAVGALTDADVDALDELLPHYSGIRRQQVLNRLAAGDLPAARDAADLMGDLSWVGHRDIGGALADRGDATEFFAGWKNYAASQDRNGMADLKRRLVTGVATSQGWQAAVAVTRDKRIGPAYARHAFDDFPTVEGLQEVLAGEAAGILSEMDECTVLAKAVRRAAGRNPTQDHPSLKGIVDRIIAVDPTTDKATMRWRDGELFGLWPAFGEQATLDRVRAAVRTPQYRRELKVLARDL